MNDKEAYQQIYGDMVYCVEKYYPKPRKEDIERNRFMAEALRNSMPTGCPYCTSQMQMQVKQSYPYGLNGLFTGRCIGHECRERILNNEGN